MRGADRMAAEETGSGTGDISGNLTFKPTRVEFTCPEEFKLDGLHVFDAKGEPVMPFTDEEKDKPVEGVYMLMPGEYTYSFYPGKEGYRDIEKTPFTVKRNQEALTIELLPEKVEQTESAEEENEAAPVRVEFVGPEDFDYASLEVFDAAGLKMAPVNDAESGKALPGVYELVPGEYSYRIAADGEEAEQAEKTAFTVEPGQEKMTIDLQPEAHSEVKEFTEVVTTPPEQVPAEPQQSAGPGVWGIAVGALIIGAALGGVLMRLLGGRMWKGARGGRLRIQAKAVQGVGARSDQQDALYMSDGRLYDKQGILMCVADGMGGLSDGAKMSQAVVSAVERGFAIEEKDDPERLIFDLTKQATEAANRAISPNFGVGGSTMVMGYLRSGEFTFVSVGDSRISLYRDGMLWHLNRRHVFEEDLKLSALNGAGSYDAAVTDKKKGALTSFLGMGKLKYADLPDARIPLQRGDRIVLMSDGVFNTLSDEELAAILSRKVGTITGEIAEQIKQKANRYQDNFTAIVVAVE